VKANQADHKIATMCRVLGVSRSGYYAWRKRAPSIRSEEDERLKARIDEIHEQSRGTYGVPRIYIELKDSDERVSRKRIARLMRDLGLRGVCRRRFVKTTRRDDANRPAPDLVERNFSASKPNQLWVADATYIPTWEGFLYLAVVLDVFSRRIVGWAMANHLRTELMLDALTMAVAQRRPDEGVIHHSDQGSQYTSIAFGNRSREMEIQISMGSVGDCYDNAMAESFFATLECELIDRTTFHTRKEAQLEVFDFIEAFYNRKRRHSSIDYLSPVNFECRSAPAEQETMAESNRSDSAGLLPT
jgi:putative transposase